MDKKQQIEDLAGAICNTCKELMAVSEKCKNRVEVCIAAYAHAERLYFAGYRKIDGDNYVSREWHDEQVLHLESELERLKSEKENVERNCAVITKAEWKEYQKQAYLQVFETLTNRIEKYYSQYYSTMTVIMQAITDEMQTIVLDKYGEHLNVAQEVKELKQRAVKEFSEKLKANRYSGFVDVDKIDELLNGYK